MGREDVIHTTQAGLAQAIADATNGTLVGVEQLVQAFYPELKRLAASKMRQESPNHSWHPTLLVNELYLELLKVKALRSVHPQDSVEKTAFFALAAQVMRWLLIRHTRPLSWKARKEEVPLSLAIDKPGADTLTELDDLLQKLSDIDPQLRAVVELRVFEGLSIEETAERIACSTRTVTRLWRFAKLWLQEQMSPREVAIS